MLTLFLELVGRAALAARRSFRIVSGVVVVIVIFSVAVTRRPRHLVLLLQASARIGKPSGHLNFIHLLPVSIAKIDYLSESHLGHNGKDHLLGLGGIGIATVVVEPLLQRHCHLASGVLAPSTVHSERVRVETRVPVVHEAPDWPKRHFLNWLASQNDGRRTNLVSALGDTFLPGSGRCRKE